MKHLAAVLLCLAFSFTLHTVNAQSNITNDYVIVSTADVTNTIPYTDALDAANWEPFRLQNTRRVLAFENGFTIELKSAIELLTLGYPLNLTTYAESLPVGYVTPALKLLSGNIIGFEAASTPSKTH